MKPLEKKRNRLYRQLGRHISDFGTPTATKVIRKIYTVEAEMNLSQNKRLSL